MEKLEKVYEDFRGVEELVYAMLLKDTLDEFETGPVKPMAGVAEISKTTATASEPKYYDNAPRNNVTAEGADTIEMTVAPPRLATLAEITGKSIDEETGALMDGAAKPVYVCIGYKFGLTDGTNRYVWRYKCSIGIPDEASKVKDAGTETTNQKLTVTGIETTHKFTKPKASQKSLVVDERDGKADLSTFFETVTTIDTLKPKSAVVNA